MSITARASEKLMTAWRALKEARGKEIFTNYPSVTLEMVGQALDHLASTINALEEKSLFDTAPELAVADKQIAAELLAVASLLQQGPEHGLDHVANNGFFPALTKAQTTVAALTTKRIGVTREVAKDLAKRGLPELERVIAAGDAATAILESQKKVDEVLAAIADASEKSRAASESLAASASNATSATAEIKKLEGESKASAQAAADAGAKIEGTSRAILKLKEDAEERERALEDRVSAVNDEVASLKSEVEDARSRLQVALRMARDQGLAHSFQSRSDMLRSERRLWAIAFIGAAAVLATLSTVFVIELDSLTYQALTVALLRKLALAAPAVWLGWYAARQVGRVARVQEDYEYKAASALAFQSYKEEAALGADPELIKQLLKHAIDTFGENPVRLYADVTNDPVSPVESGLKALPPDKLIALLTAALDAAGRKKS